MYVCLYLYTYATLSQREPLETNYLVHVCLCVHVHGVYMYMVCVCVCVSVYFKRSCAVLTKANGINCSLKYM